MIIKGNFKEVVDAFESCIEPKRKNDEIKIDLKKILAVGIDKYQKRLQTDQMLPFIEASHSKLLLEKLTK
jgi:hypothetical protein